MTKDMGVKCMLHRFAYLIIKIIFCYYRKTLHNVDIRHTTVGNKNVDHSDVVGALPVDAVPTTSIFILDLTPGFNGLGKDSCKMRRETFQYWDLVWLILEV